MSLAIQLYPHNRMALENLKAMLQQSSRAAVIQPTGTGKSFVALAMMEDFRDEAFLYLSPSNHIFDQLCRHAEDPAVLEHTRAMTYQKLCLVENSALERTKYDFIILDEFHRCGAQEWGQGVRRLLSRQKAARVIGFTATPIRYLDRSGVRDMAEELFGNCIANYYSLRQAMDDHILPAPRYVLGDIQMHEKLAAREAAVNQIQMSGKERAAADRLLKELRRNMAQAIGVDQIFRDNLSGPAAKLIVFCRNLDHIEQARQDMRRWLGSHEIREYVCRSDDGEAEAELGAFVRDTRQDAVRLLFAVNIVNEGIHVKDLDGIVMLRPTASPTVYLQQIGRCLASASDRVSEPIIFDLVNNYESARIDGDDRRVFQMEFMPYTPREQGEHTPIPFEITGSVAQFQTVLDKFDHLFTSKKRWEFICGLLRDYLDEHKRYPLHRDCYCGVNIGFWLSRQIDYWNNGSLPVPRREALQRLPGWDKYIADRRRGGFHEEAAMRQWWRSYRRLKEYLDAHAGEYPRICENANQYAWYRRSARQYLNDMLAEDQRRALEQLPNWHMCVSSCSPRAQHSHELSIQKAASLLKAYTAAHEGANPPQYYCTEDGYKLGRKVDRLRQKKRGGFLLPDDVRLLEDAGMIWQVRTKKPPQSFDFYYEHLLRYHDREGHIRVPQTYVVPGTDCKLGIFIQRMRMAFKEKGGYRITPEQISRLDALGMVWDASLKKQSKENHYESDRTSAP